MAPPRFCVLHFAALILASTTAVALMLLSAHRAIERVHSCRLSASYSNKTRKEVAFAASSTTASKDCQNGGFAWLLEGISGMAMSGSTDLCEELSPDEIKDVSIGRAAIGYWRDWAALKESKKLTNGLQAKKGDGESEDEALGQGQKHRQKRTIGHGRFYPEVEKEARIQEHVIGRLEQKEQKLALDKEKEGDTSLLSLGGGKKGHPEARKGDSGLESEPGLLMTNLMSWEQTLISLYTKEKKKGQYAELLPLSLCQLLANNMYERVLVPPSTCSPKKVAIAPNMGHQSHYGHWVESNRSGNSYTCRW